MACHLSLSPTWLAISSVQYCSQSWPLSLYYWLTIPFWAVTSCCWANPQRYSLYSLLFCASCHSKNLIPYSHLKSLDGLRHYYHKSSTCGFSVSNLDPIKSFVAFGLEIFPCGLEGNTPNSIFLAEDCQLQCHFQEWLLHFWFISRCFALKTSYNMDSFWKWTPNFEVYLRKFFHVRQ